MIMMEIDTIPVTTKIISSVFTIVCVIALSIDIPLISEIANTYEKIK